MKLRQVKTENQFQVTRWLKPKDTILREDRLEMRPQERKEEVSWHNSDCRTGMATIYIIVLTMRIRVLIPDRHHRKKLKYIPEI